MLVLYSFDTGQPISHPAVACIERLFGDTGNFGLQLQMAFGDAEPALRFVESDGAGGLETVGLESRLRELIRERHGKAARMRRGQQLFRIGSLPLLEAAVE